jgi:hypothetical protein
MANFLSSLPTFAEVRSDNPAILPHRRVLPCCSPSTRTRRGRNGRPHQHHLCKATSSAIGQPSSRWEDGQSQSHSQSQQPRRCRCGDHIPHKKIEGAPRLPSRPTSSSRSAGDDVPRLDANHQGPSTSVPGQEKASAASIAHDKKDPGRPHALVPSIISAIPTKPRRRLSSEGSSRDRLFAHATTSSPPLTCRLAGDWSSSIASVARHFDDLQLQSSWTSSTTSSSSTMLDSSTDTAQTMHRS